LWKNVGKRITVFLSTRRPRRTSRAADPRWRRPERRKTSGGRRRMGWGNNRAIRIRDRARRRKGDGGGMGKSGFDQNDQKSGIRKQRRRHASQIQQNHPFRERNHEKAAGIKTPESVNNTLPAIPHHRIPCIHCQRKIIGHAVNRPCFTSFPRAGS
jgi:hypothetical protein